MDLLNTITSSRFWNRHGVNVAWAVGVLALVIAVSVSGWSEYQNYQARQLDYAPQSIAPVQQNTTRTSRAADIVRANLFGDPAPVVRKVTRAPKTTLNLELQGILWASDPQFARAIIGSGKKAGKLYSVGDQIKGASASIKEIKSGEVLLNRNGATESLPLVKKTTSGDRQIISFSPVTTSGITEVSLNTPSEGVNRRRFDSEQMTAASQRVKQARQRAANGAPRKIRRPNFSGLDKALKKMGEL